jgi:hypothetical protein
MRKILFVALAQIIAVHAEAAVYPIFNQAQNQATFMMAGLTGDADAQAMFDALAMSQQDEQGKWTKKVKYTDRNGTQALSVVCVFSKLVPGNGSCTLVLKASPGMQIDFSAKSVLWVVEGAEAAKLAELFLPAATGDFFHSGNGRLVMHIDRNETGAPARFGLSFR